MTLPDLSAASLDGFVVYILQALFARGGGLYTWFELRWTVGESLGLHHNDVPDDKLRAAVVVGVERGVLRYAEEHERPQEAHHRDLIGLAPMIQIQAESYARALQDFDRALKRAQGEASDPLAMPASFLASRLLQRTGKRR